jgi:hypothetical protein
VGGVKRGLRIAWSSRSCPNGDLAAVGTTTEIAIFDGRSLGAGIVIEGPA